MGRARVVNINRVEADYEGAHDVYVGRPGQGFDGYFGNPIRPGVACPECGVIHTQGHETLTCFEKQARARLATDAKYAGRVVALHGKRLFCFCAPRPCHGEILARLAEELTTSAGDSALTAASS